MSVWRTAATFRAERAKASTWILTLVHRRAVDLVRREERRRADPLDDAARDAVTTASAEDSAWLGFERERVQTALRELPDNQREALELAYYGGYSQSELAERLGVPLGTIKSRMFAGLTRLRELLDDAAPKDHGTRNPRADRRLRAGRPRPGRAGGVRAPSRGLRALPGGARVLLGGDGCARARLRRAGAAAGPARADPRGGARRAADGRRPLDDVRAAPAAAGAHRCRRDRGGRRDRSRHLRDLAQQPARRRAFRALHAGGCRRGARRSVRDIGRDGSPARAGSSSRTAAPPCSCSTTSPRRRRGRRTRHGSWTGKTPASAGTFAESDGRAVVPIPQPVPDGAVVAVTVEDEGGAESRRCRSLAASDPV